MLSMDIGIQALVIRANPFSFNNIVDLTLGEYFWVLINVFSLKMEAGRLSDQLNRFISERAP